MSFQFPSDEWIKELMVRLNNSEAYQTAAAKWEGDFAFSAVTQDGVETVLYMDLWRGQCRSARQLVTADELKPAFTLSGTTAVWQEVLTGQLDPIKGIMKRKLSLTGNKIKVLQNTKAAKAMVEAAQTIPTVWPQ